MASTVAEYEEIVDDLEYQLQLAGQAGLDLLEANTELTDRVAELEEIELHSTDLASSLRQECLQLQHELERTRAGRDRAMRQVSAADEERDRLQIILNEQAHQHMILEVTRRHLRSEIVESHADDDQPQRGKGKHRQLDSLSISSGTSIITSSDTAIDGHHHIAKSAAEASDHVTLTLNAAHTGLISEESRHEKLRMKYRKGMIEAMDWRHHETEHKAAVARWRGVAKMAQTTANHHDVTHQLIASKQKAAATAAAAAAAAAAAMRDDDSDSGEDRGAGSLSRKREMARMTAENEQLSESVVVLEARVEVADKELMTTTNEHKKTLEKLHFCEDRVMIMVEDRDVVMEETKRLRDECAEMSMILEESQRERRGGGHRTRHLSTMDSFLMTPRRLVSKSTLKKNDSLLGVEKEKEKEELGKRRLHDMLPPSFVLKSAPSFLSSGGGGGGSGGGGGKRSGERKRSLLTKQKSVARMRRLVGDTTGSDVAHGERLDRRALELEREMAKMEHREMEEEGKLVLGLEVRFYAFLLFIIIIYTGTDLV